MDPSSSPAPTLPPGDLYTTPGYHSVNGREWFTQCEPYSQTMRCTTDIWATQVVFEGGAYVHKHGWHFNNLTYLPLMTRQAWVGNPLGVTGTWTSSEGRTWRTECDTPATGRNGCRSYIWSKVVQAEPLGHGRYDYQQRWEWVFNNLVRFKA
ncbi:hypothetical protein FOJ82_09850 [Tessaracoccus rhinocerotis]|uniref:Uncharacterized protein n=1 Tax=Tessaracoccus rhinocerotis TaxID=1689449 RepID=A0A553K0U2_9ACTN|nr:hypothetical protein [Tessaracoccus rhinocerotis]TRY18322.1 hypothetical protein FOJ82_09850 [Tessaracoccus rhinocerotis]